MNIVFWASLIPFAVVTAVGPHMPAAIVYWLLVNLVIEPLQPLVVLVGSVL